MTSGGQVIKITLVCVCVCAPTYTGAVALGMADRFLKSSETKYLLRKKQFRYIQETLLGCSGVGS